MGFFDKIKQGLTKTRDKLGGFVENVLSSFREVDEDLLDEAGRLRLDKAGLAAYVHGTYYALGKQLGTVGYSVRKKPARRRK